MFAPNLKHHAMKKESTINRRISKLEESLSKIKAAESLNPVYRKRAIYTIRILLRELKWVVK
jgi:TATA-binding protein-associated factor Taf7